MFASRAVTVVVAALLLAGASMCPAQIPQKMNYQVMLTDDSDQPLADQSVQLVFRIYNVEAGGGQLWTETHNVMTNSVGVVSVILGETNPLTISFDGPLWLQVEVDGQVLSPRRELVSSPYALSDAGSGDGDGYSLDADDGSPADVVYVDASGNVGVGTTSPQADLDVRNQIQVGSASTAGALTVKGGYATDGAIRIEGEGADGGTIYFDDGIGQTFGFLGATASGNGGGRLFLSRNGVGSTGFYLDANHNSTQNPKLEMYGSSHTLILDMDQSGDDSVDLPSDAISATEILDEPGVASRVVDAEGTITASMSYPAIRSLTAPSTGYIVAIATASLTLYHSYGYNTGVRIGLTDDYPSYAPSQDNTVVVPSLLPTGPHFQVVTVQGVFSVTGGTTKTIRLYTVRTSDYNTCYSSNVQMTLLFFPNSGYGTVDVVDASPAAAGPEPATLEPELDFRPTGFSELDDQTRPPSDAWNRDAAVSAGGVIEVPTDVLADILSRLERMESTLRSNGMEP